MAILNKDYYKGADIYSDGSVEDIILDYVKKGISLDDIEVERMEYPIFYHLSHERENIVNWYPFGANDRILEVGAGCGAITGALCKKAKEVVSVDLSLKRSTINFERHKDLDNLTIMVGNLNDMKFDFEFDYVVLNGVLEYAIGFTEGDRPYETFLNNQLKYLKQDGKILIAIENRIGLKYFAGAPEDHTDLYFAGLNGYKDIKGVRTFTQKELKEILCNCGLNYQKFYYPYPDYKFPTEIFTDDSLASQNYGRDYYRFNDQIVKLFDESTVARTLAKEGVAAKFANSFFIEASKEDFLATNNKISYVKMNSDRDEKFRIITTIEENEQGLEVRKTTLNDKAQKHIDGINKHELAGVSNRYELLKGKLTDKGIIYPFLKVENLSEKAKKRILTNDVKGVFEILDCLYDLIGEETAVKNEEIYNDRFVEVFGNDKLDDADTVACVNPANIDLILANIFEDSGKFMVIDGEWVFDFNVPKAFIMWRAIKELTSDCPKLWEIIYIEDIYKKYNVLEKDKETYRRWDEHFALHYVKANKNRLYSYEPKAVDISPEALNNRYVLMNLYIDYQNTGFSEEIKLQSRVFIRANNYRAEFDLSGYDVNQIGKLRFDPIEGRECFCSANAGSVRLKAINAKYLKEDKDVFVTSDPQYKLDKKYINSDGMLVIEGFLKEITYKDTISFLEDMSKSGLKKSKLFR